MRQHFNKNKPPISDMVFYLNRPTKQDGAAKWAQVQRQQISLGRKKAWMFREIHFLAMRIRFKGRNTIVTLKIKPTPMTPFHLSLFALSTLYAFTHPEKPNPWLWWPAFIE